MDYVKEAFSKVKQDIGDLKNEMSSLKFELKETRENLIEICEIIKKIEEKTNNNSSTHDIKDQTVKEETSTHKSSLEALNNQNSPISTGNEGVSTDRQTDRQTDKYLEKGENITKNSFENALEVLNSLDNLKKEIRLQFKRITEQELIVFSTIYQLEEEKGYANYKLIAEKLNLTQSSVRDHVRSLIKKGIPVDKRKIDNKQISLFISEKLKKIAPLSTILQLRDL